MNIEDYKSLDKISEKDMLKFLFANQIQIMRQISLLEWHLDKKVDQEKEIEHFKSDVGMFVRKTDVFLKRVDEYLSEDDLEKGQLKF